MLFAYWITFWLTLITAVFLFFFNRKIKNTPLIKEQALTVNEEEVFILSITEQLDLARAYIDMEDYLSAQAILEKILALSDETYHDQARTLLRKCDVQIKNENRGRH